MINDMFREKLLDGEKIVWSGQPGQGIILVVHDAIMIPFSIMWGGFAIFWEVIVITNEKSPFFMKIWGVPFVIVGVYLIFGRFVLDSYIRKRMYYAVTSQRILIMRSRPFASFTTLSINRISDLKITENSKGRGTIYFGLQSQAIGRNGFNGLKFFAIENAQTVFAKIQRALGAS